MGKRNLVGINHGFKAIEVTIPSKHILEGSPVEIHVSDNGFSEDGPFFAIVTKLHTEVVIVSHLTFSELNTALADIGYTISKL